MVMVQEGDTSGISLSEIDQAMHADEMAHLFFGAMVAAGFSAKAVASAMIEAGEEQYTALEGNIG
jgi:hypothetical protein